MPYPRRTKETKNKTGTRDKKTMVYKGKSQRQKVEKQTQANKNHYLGQAEGRGVGNGAYDSQYEGDNAEMTNRVVGDVGHVPGEHPLPAMRNEIPGHLNPGESQEGKGAVGAGVPRVGKEGADPGWCDVLETHRV